MRVPGLTLFSTTSVGELKNTIESLRANRTRAAATPSTARPEPINASRRCLRVMSPFQPEFLHQRIETADLVRLASQCAARVRCRRARLVRLAQHHIGTQQAQPSFDIGSILLQPCRETIHHA